MSECFESYGAFFDGVSRSWEICAEDEVLAAFNCECDGIRDRVDMYPKERLGAESYMLSIMLRNLSALEPHLRRFVEGLLIKT